MLGAVGCGDGETTTSTSSSSSATTGSGGEGGSATSTTGSGGASSSSSASSSASGTGGAAVMLGDVDVTVNYAGAQTGTLSVAAITSFPPMGPPVAFQSIKMPMFSQKVTLIGLEAPKDYYIVAVLDIGNNNPTNPGPEDLVAITMPAVKVVADKAIAVDLTLKDK
ncbi:MAG: hypothetical protein ACMG6S_01585 [Byssovorax sp.]